MKLVPSLALLALLALAASAEAAPSPSAPDPRLREVVYDRKAIVTVPVKRGVVTLVMLDADESITEVASGLGADCSKAEAAWCVAAQPGGRSIFIKPKSTANVPNNLAVVTDRRTHAFRFVVLPDADSHQPVYRLTMTSLPTRAPAPPSADVAALTSSPEMPSPPSPQAVVLERLQARPPVRNSNYSLAEGAASDDIVPSLVFDDGRFTYFRFPGNREVPAVFHVLGDGSETLLNARMEDDLLVVDRVSRQLMLRSGSAVVGVRNEAFDLDGVPPVGATTVPGVERSLKPDAHVDARAGNTREATP